MDFRVSHRCLTTGSELFTAYRTLDVLEIDPPYIGRRNPPTAFPADGIERFADLLVVDFS